MSVPKEEATMPPPSSQMPPPSSQSHFAKYQGFVPDDDASFDDEFARLASSQNWIPGSQAYVQERTIAMREEITLHYFRPSQNPDGTVVPLTRAEILEGFRELCREIHIPAGDSIGRCKRSLKGTLVNIVDLIDARRTSKPVKVWDDFGEFRDYTLQKEHMIHVEEAKKPPGFLAALLQRIHSPRRGGSRGGRAGRDGSRRGVSAGRITKRRFR
ncbi:hypothetical protein E4U43_001524 [Claviceps pusilla]|uniref:Uncharacterized protein n=1 Tax=Claviceps pusilla TaxID=123648 RepID=A0A9P7NH16_9HYPO|nr:hypothetical protein E4U43_001524 [Claviceps pusilla]